MRPIIFSCIRSHSLNKNFDENDTILANYSIERNIIGWDKRLKYYIGELCKVWQIAIVKFIMLYIDCQRAFLSQNKI